MTHFFDVCVIRSSYLSALFAQCIDEISGKMTKVGFLCIFSNFGFPSAKFS